MKKIIEYLSQIAKFESALFKSNFSAKSYLETYYPSDFNLKEYMNVSRHLFSSLTNNAKLSVSTVKEKSGLSEEEIENIIIMIFLEKILIYLSLKHKDNLLVLDVGGGPTIYQHIFNSIIAKRIIHTDFLAENRKQVVDWVNSSDNAYNWDNYIKLGANMLADADSILGNELFKDIDFQHIKLNLKSKISNVEHGDVFKKDFELSNKLLSLIKANKGVDLLTSNFTIESATSSFERWKEGMKNVVEIIKDNGYISISCISNAYWYQVGDKKLPATSINTKDLTGFLELENFKIIYSYELNGSESIKVGYDGMIFIFAQKLEKKV